MSYPTPLYYHFIFALELKHIADWQDRKNNDNELCINENLNSSLSNFGKLVRLRTPECYLSCSWQETLQLVLGLSVCAKQNSFVQLCGPWSLSSSSLMAKEGNKHFFPLLLPLSPFFLELMWAGFGTRSTAVKRKCYIYYNSGTWSGCCMKDKQE